MEIAGIGKKFSVFDMVMIAMLASLGIACKPIVAPVMNAAGSLFMIPGGALQSGIFMFWLVLARVFVGKFGAASLTALVQSLMVMLIGIVGNHGLLSLITYTLPGVAIDLVYMLPGLRRQLAAILGGAASCVVAFALRVELMVHLPVWMLFLGCGVAALSGVFGGFFAHMIAGKLQRFSGKDVL